jgi:thiol:disulfide interchange protein DsbC
MFKKLSVLTAALLGLSSLGAVSGAMAGEAEVRAAVKLLNPQAIVDSVKPTPAKGWMEVTLGGQIIYFSDDGKYLLQGSLVETATRRNLTEDAQAVVRVVELNKLQRKDMIVFPAKGTPKHVVKVFTDIDCGYCRKLHTEIKSYTDLGIEVQYLFFPRAGVPSDSSRKAIAVFCAKDQRKAMTDAKNNIDPGAATCVNPIERDYNLGQKIGVNGTPAIFLTDGTLMPGYMPAAQLFAELEKHAATKKAN